MTRIPREITRTRILDAAHRLFVARGFNRVTVEDIATKAGFTRGAVYSNFANKAEIFVALIDRRFDDQLDRALEDLSADLDSSERVAALARWIAAEASRSREWSTAELEFYAFASSDPELSVRMMDVQRAGRADFADFLVSQCQRIDVEIDIPPEHLAAIVNSLVRGLMLEWMVDLSTDVAGLFVAAFTRLLGVPPVAPRSDDRTPAHSEGDEHAH
ncbi:TetR/AcrR family transcriptional regulator [Microbacterium sp.]|uniref:TetR/AcrR family transcriptional regulator n=1 Tax=Microbacterium sp. TaxID=51671 RepID=UPI002634FEA1|nr:TetR/AcrR family transcriptional regulator [Microbacterium sp.]